MSFHVLARAVAKPSARQQLRDALLAVVEPTRKEPGCVRYHVVQSTTDANEFAVVEEYRSEADFQAHMQKPYLKDLLAKAPALVAVPPEIKTFLLVK